MNANATDASDPALRSLDALLPDLAELYKDVHSHPELPQFGRDELLRRPDVADVAVSSDVAYGNPMTYRAVPRAALLVGLNPPPDSVIESVALDGFAAQLPLDLLTNSDPAKAVAWLAIEPARPHGSMAKSWPRALTVFCNHGDLGTFRSAAAIYLGGRMLRQFQPCIPTRGTQVPAGPY